MVRSTFLKLFPPPRFLKVDWVGLSITDESVRMVELKDTNSGMGLGAFTSVDVPKGLIEAGQITDRAKLVNILKQVRKISHTAHVNASLPEEKSYLFTVDVNDGNGDEIRRNIEFVLEENIPIPPSETLFEFDVIGPSNKGDGKVSVSVTAMPSRIAEEYASVIAEAGFEAYSLEVEGRPIARNVIPRSIVGTNLIVNINDRNVGLFLVSDEIIRFTSTVGLDDKEIPDTFMKNGAVDIKNYIAHEIDKVFSFWYGKNLNNRIINSIILTGKNALDDNFLTEIRKIAKAKVNIADVWVNVYKQKNSVPAIEYSKSLEYTVAIGLALKGR